MERSLWQDKECITCEKLFVCKGKPKGITCVNYVEREGREDGNKIHNTNSAEDKEE